MGASLLLSVVIDFQDKLTLKLAKLLEVSNQ